MQRSRWIGRARHLFGPRSSVQGLASFVPAASTFRRWAAAQSLSPWAAQESTFEIFRLMHQEGDETGTSEEGAPGQVLASSGNGLLRVSLPGPVSLGQAVDVDGSLGFVVQFDRRGAAVALLDAGCPRRGAPVTPRGTLTCKHQSSSGGVVFLSVQEALEASLRRSTCGEGSGVLALPALPPPGRRRPVSRPLASGLAAVEALLPLAQGHRAGLVGPAGTGKSTAARMLLQTQRQRAEADRDGDSACVYAALKPLQHLKDELGKPGSSSSSAPLTILHADPRDQPGAQYLLPLCALHTALQLSQRHHHVLLVLDDLTTFAQAAAELNPPPLSATQVVSSALYTGGNEVAPDGRERAISVVAVLDLEPEEDLPGPLRALWQSAEPAFDCTLSFSAGVAAKGVLPAIDPEKLLASGFPPRHQPPLLQLLRKDLLEQLRQGRDLAQKLELSRHLGLHVEMQDEEDAGKAEVARALLAHSQPVSAAELVVLLAAALIYHFPSSCLPTPSAVKSFQRCLIDTVRTAHPDLWRLLDHPELLDEEGATRAAHELGVVLLSHRLEFELTQARQ